METMKKVLMVFVVLLALVSVPMTIYVLSGGTQTRTEAIFDFPDSLIDDFVGRENDGITPVTELEIDLVWPFIGKVGDAVAIFGHHFGDDPEQSILFFGATSVEEDDFLSWSDTSIYFKIPSISSGPLSAPITLMKVGSSASWEIPFIVYDEDTRMQLLKPDDSVLTKDIPSDYQLEVYLDDGSILYGRPSVELVIPSGREVLSAVVKNPEGDSVDFFVEPSDFGF